MFVCSIACSHVIWGAVAGEEPRNFGPLIVLCAGMVLAAIIDGWAFKVPNWLTLSLVVSGWLIGLVHDCGVAIDAGQGGIGSALGLTVVGFLLLFPLLAIIGMGQGDVKMLMGFGSWIGAFFGMKAGLMILVWAFCLGAIVGGVFGLVMMACRRKFSKNLSNFKDIVVDLRVMADGWAPAANAFRQQAQPFRPGWDRLPYGIPPAPSVSWATCICTGISAGWGHSATDMQAHGVATRRRNAASGGGWGDDYPLQPLICVDSLEPLF